MSDPNGSEGEFNVSGRAELVTDPAVWEAGDGWWKSFPADASSVYSVDLESAALVSWNFQPKEVTHWSTANGVSSRTAEYP